MPLKKLHDDIPIANKTSEEQSPYPATENEQALWNAFRKGDEAAFVTIYKKYFTPLYRYASQFCADTSFIEDCVQDLFIEIRQKRHRLSSTTSIKAYLFKSLKNLVIYRSRRRQKLLQRYIQRGHQFACTLSAEELHIQLQQEKEVTQRLNRSLAQLSDRQKEAIYYYYFENFSYADIKELMGMRYVRSARNLIYRASEALRKNFQL